MGLFDSYIAVDWSAADGPNTGRDSIWISERSASGVAEPSRNPATRTEAMVFLEGRIERALADGERVFVGFDFPFGYPAGAAAKLGDAAAWQSVWTALDQAVTDGDTNRSNRFEAAGALNLRLSADTRHFWGHPQNRDYAHLSSTKDKRAYSAIAEKRIVEQRAKGAKPVWQLSGAGCVGSQALVGIPRLLQLRVRFGTALAVWPFETDFERDLSRPVTIAEIYPSLVPIDPCIDPKDRAQVEAYTSMLLALDSRDALSALLAAPDTLSEEEKQAILREEGWIVGVGKEQEMADALPHDELAPGQKPALDYIRDPAEIYARSFAIVRAEADLARFDVVDAEIAIRMIHACGQVEIADKLMFSGNAGKAGVAALAAGKPVLCDAEMVAAGIIRKRLPGDNTVICTLNDAETPGLAARLANTRSAAAVELWRGHLDGAVVVIGNAPTSLFHLLELLDEGWPKPALIIGLPVGFVGAAESKAELAANSRGVPAITLRGRLGGSAMAAAAVNAIAGLAGAVA